MLTLTAAVAAFCASISLLTLTALTKTEKKKPVPLRKLSELDDGDYPHFPKRGLRIVLKPDTVIEELDLVRRPETYREQDVMLVIKLAKGKTEFNPVIIKRLMLLLKDFQNFLHILLIDEHDEYVGYIPAFWARQQFVGSNGETQIVKYVIDVLKQPYGPSLALREIGGLSIEDTIFDYETVTTALARVSGGFQGLVVCHRSLRRPVGVLYKDSLVGLTLPKG